MSIVGPLTLLDIVDAEGVPERGWVFLLVLTLLTLAAAIVVLVLVELVVRLTTTRQPWTAVLLRHTRLALRLLLVVVAVQVAVSLAAPASRFSEAIDRILTIGSSGSSPGCSSRRSTSRSRAPRGASPSAPRPRAPRAAPTRS